MMRDDTKAILDDLLGRWHAWAKGFSPVAPPGFDPMFADATSSRQYDSSDDVLDGQINSKIMAAVDFQVSEMTDPHRTGIYINARNVHTGRSVWSSPRLPADPLERGVVVTEARVMLLKRLIAAGVV